MYTLESHSKTSPILQRITLIVTEGQGPTELQSLLQQYLVDHIMNLSAIQCWGVS